MDLPQFLRECANAKGSTDLDDYFDLRPLIGFIWKRRLMIASGALLCLVIAVLSWMLWPERYEATALVAATSPRQIFQFDSRIESPNDTSLPVRALPDIALSDEVLLTLLTRLDGQLSGWSTTEELREDLSTQVSPDLNLVFLTVGSTDADLSAKTVNIWADLVVTRANELFADSGGAQLQFFETQLEGAGTELASLEDALIAFQLSNRETIVANQLMTLTEAYTHFLEEALRYESLEQQLEGLESQLESGQGALNFAEQLSSLIVQLELVAVASNDDNVESAIQFELNSSDTLTTEDRDVQLEIVDQLIAIAVAKNGEMSANAAELEPEMLALQQELQQLQTEHARILRDVDVATETFIALSHKVDEERITAADTSNGFRIASEASVPLAPSTPSVVVWAIIGLILGSVLAVSLIVLRYWWQLEG